MNQSIIREIRPDDDQALEKLVRNVFEELGIPKVGTAYADPALKKMSNAYTGPRSIYYVVEQNGRIVGGAGVAPLDNYPGNVCELQKMYFSEEARGLGIGAEMMEKCLQKAKEFGFEACYLETMPYMEAAQKLYRKSGFDYIDAPLGSTGHNACPVYMLKKFD